MSNHQKNILFFLFNLLWIILFFQDSKYFWVLLGVASLFFLSWMTMGVISLKTNYFSKNIISLNTNQVLLTFDDGPHDTYTNEILAILKRQNVGAVFFVIGKQCNKLPEITQSIIKNGHLIANHTQNHPIFFAMNRQEKVEKEIALCDNTLIAQNIHPGHFFRPPVGYTNPRIARAIKKFNKKIIGWNLRSFDTVIKDEKKLYNRVITKVKPNDIILFHDNLPQTASILEKFIIATKKKGINFVSIEQLKTVLT